MNRACALVRSLSLAVTLSGLLFGASSACAQAAARMDAEGPARPPNIIYIVADDLGYGEVGCYGQKWIRTPNIDRIAADGLKFTQHYSGSPVCAPSRCVVMTGMHTGHSYIRDNGNPPGREHDNSKSIFPGQNPIPDETVTIAELLKQRGYATAAIGKWGLGFEGSEGDPNRQGFDLFFGYLGQIHAHNHYPRFLWRNDEKIMLEGNDRKLSGSDYSQDLFIEEAVQFVRENEDRPFFLYLPFIIPHLSIQAPEGTVEQYVGVIPEEEHEHRGYLKHPTPRAGYAAMITHMDAGIGEIMATVKDLGLDENTLIIFTSDNGPTYGRLGGSDSDFFESSGPLRGRKGSLYEGGVRVPFVARWPGQIDAGTVSDHVSAFWDMLPTFCEVAGAESPGNVDGISFLPTLIGEDEQEAHEYLYWEFPSYGYQQSVRFGDWKAIRTDCRKNPNAPLQLYNLKDDLGETNDVASEHPELIARAWEIIDEAHIDSELFPFPERATAESLSSRGEIPKNNWSLVRVDSESRFNGKVAGNAFDGDPSTWWHTAWRDVQSDHPHELVIDLGAAYDITGLRYLPRQDGGINGTIIEYEIYFSDHADVLGEPVATGKFKPVTMVQEVQFAKTRGRYLMLRSLSAVRDQPFASVAEISLLGK